jgi:cobalt-zinc-cadmium efflux system outer membrane protein
MIRRSLPLLAVLLTLAGCLHPVRQEIDATVCELASCPRDVMPESPASAPSMVDPVDSAIRPAGLEIADGDKQDLPTPRKDAETKTPLTIPKDLPGSGAKPIELPPILPKNQEERRKVLEKLYPDLGPLGPDPAPQPGPHGQPLTLDGVQREALARNPLIVQAVANVIAARGTALQAGLPPNPNVSFQHGNGSSISQPGLEGVGIEQMIRTFGKLQYARAVAAMDLRNAEIAQRRAETDLMTRVRGFYFAVLVADEGVRVNRALVDFTEQIYQNQLAMLIKGDLAAGYEPMQLRQFVMQARAALVAARNRYVSAWKQLASAIGDPGLPPTQIVGAKDMPYPIYDYGDVLHRVLLRHTDVLTAQNTVLRAQYALKLARVTVAPDVDVSVILQKDMAGGPGSFNNTVTMTVPIPLWDRNQGGILNAEAQLSFADEEEHRVRTALTTTLTDAFERYDTNRAYVAYYRDSVLPDGVRSYEALYKRYRVGLPNPTPDWPAFSSIVSTQQIMVTNVATYLSNLALFWQAVADVTDLLQTDNLYAYARGKELPPLPMLPCAHPCAPLHGPELEAMHGEWPNAVPPGPTEKQMLKVTERSKPPDQLPMQITRPAPTAPPAPPVRQPEKAVDLKPVLAPTPVPNDGLLLEPPPIIGQSAQHSGP